MLVASGAAAQADVVVTVAPQGVASDFIYRSTSERDSLIREIVRFLQSLGADMPKGRSLKVELLDVRPAGRIDPLATASRVRILGGATPPSVRLRYSLKQDGRTISAGEETVTDLSYLENISARTSLASFLTSES